MPTRRPRPAPGAPPTMRHERALRAAGFGPVAGIDEAGRGAWAGPVAAGAVILPLTAAAIRQLRGVTDSKMLRASDRERYAGIIREMAVSWAVGWAENTEIDALGIISATRLAMRRAVEGLTTRPAGLVIDALALPELAVAQDVFFFADAISLSVAAASILAKTARDQRMRDLDAVWPGFGFSEHKGYGTAAHMRGLQTLGPCPAHRRTFRPICLMAPIAPFQRIDNGLRATTKT